MYILQLFIKCQLLIINLLVMFIFYKQFDRNYIADRVYQLIYRYIFKSILVMKIFAIIIIINN